MEKNSPQTRVQDGSDAVLQMAGISHTPQQGYQSAGYSSKGEAVYTSTQLAKSSNTQAGALLVHTLASFVAPFHVLTKKEMDGIEHLATVSNSAQNIKRLNVDAAKINPTTFMRSILSLVKGSRSALSDKASEKVFDHWSIMSPAQKSLSIAALGIQTHKTGEGGTVCDLKIISGDEGTVTVRDALSLLQSGRNPYAIIKFWSQLVPLEKVLGSQEPTLENISDFAHSHSLVNADKNNAAVPGITGKRIAASSSKPAPQYGVGALAVPKGSGAPQGYAQAAQLQGGDIVAPQSNGKSAMGALSGSLVGTEGGDQGIGSGAAEVYKSWKKEDKKGQDKGAEGGSQLIAGLTALKGSNPYLYGALVSFLFHYTHENIKTDNPVDYFACLAGIALSRLLTGRKEKEAEGQLVALGMQANTEADFEKLQVKLRALYAHFGINSKADAYQLSNQAFSEDRINESDIVSMHEVFDILYSQNGFPEAKKLMNGKDAGLRIVRMRTPKIKNTMTAGESKDNKAVVQALSKESMIRRNKARYGNAGKPPEGSPEEEASESASQESAEQASGEEQQEAGEAPESGPGAGEIGAEA